MKLMRNAGDFFKSSKTKLAASLADWSLKKTIIVSVTSAVVLAGGVAGGVIAYRNANQPAAEQPKVAVKKIVKNKKGQVEIPTYASCALSGDSIEKDLTLYITKSTGSDEKVTGTSFKVKLVKKDDAEKIKNKDNAINMDKAYLAKAEELGVSDKLGTEEALKEVKKAVKEQLGVQEESKSEEAKSENAKADEKKADEKKADDKKSDDKNSDLEISAVTKKPVTVKEALILEKQADIADFANTLAESKGETYTDEDSDGMIHIDKIDSGDYQACMIPEKEFDADQYSVKVTVKDKLEYKPVSDIRKKVKKNVADTQHHNIQREAPLNNTVEFVNSRTEVKYDNKPIDGVKSSVSNEKIQLAVSGGSTSGRRFGLRLFSVKHLFSKKKLAASTSYVTFNPIRWATEPSNPADLSENKTVSGPSVVVPASVKIYATNYAAGNTAEFDASANDCEITSVSSQTAGVTATYGGGRIRVSANSGTTSSDINASIVIHTNKGNATYNNISVGGSGNHVKKGNEAVYTNPSHNKEMTVGEFNGNGYVKDGLKYYGFQTLNGVTYYFDKNGNKVTGPQVINGAKYNFGSDGALLVSGTGIDVSKWQGSINWSQARTAISFAIIRCGYRGSGGGLGIDPFYARNMQQAKANGVRVGIYFYSKATNEAQAVEEASLAVQLANEQGGCSLPIYFDIEDASQAGLSNAERTAICHAFCRTVQASGYRAGVYSSMSWWLNKLNNNELTQYSVWIARYNTTLSGGRYIYNGKCDIWQYSSDGTIPGINGRVDMNQSYF